MGTNLERPALDVSKYYKEGYVILKDFFNKDDIRLLREEAQQIFYNVCEDKKYTGDLLDKMKLLFTFDINAFQNCGKQAQHLVNLWKLSLQDRVIRTLHAVGLRFPNICTRPVLYFNHPDLAVKKLYHTVDAHQDWRSMQGSSNACVLWVPLVKMTKEIGCLQVLPKSHVHGLRTTSIDGGFGMVNLTAEEEEKMENVELEVGDALLFHSLLIHRSGNHTNNDIRWSCHFRYNDLEDKEFIRRGYVHPYIYRPVDELL